MGFPSLGSELGLSTLNEYLADKSYIEGYQPSQADKVVFQGLSESSIEAKKYPHLSRWFKHIKSFGDKRELFKGEAKNLSAYGPPGVAGDDVSTEQVAKKEDDELDLFGSDEDDQVDQAAEQLKQQRLAEYAAKKANKPQVVAKSSILLDVKPWDDETNMEDLEKHVRSIEMDGLVWGASKFVPVGYGIKKLQISCVVEDDKVGTIDLEEKILAFEDHVQSIDVAAFNKI